MGTQTVSLRNTDSGSSRGSRQLGCSAAIPLLLMLCAFCYFPLGCATGAGSSTASPMQASQAATSTGVVGSQFFGMVVRETAHQPTVAAGSRRLWDAGVTWAALEPAPGSFVWGTLDAEVAAAEQAGAAVTLTLGMTPTWASSQPTVASAYGAGATAMPAQLADWDAYVQAVATRYKGRIESYEVWNAPANATYWGGAPARLGTDMALLSAHAAAAVHAADPAALVVSPALGADSLTQFLTAGGADQVDVLGASVSLAGNAPEAVIPALAALHSALGGSSVATKPLWNDQPSWTLPSAGLSQQGQAAWAARALVLNASFGVARLAWYAWDQADASALRLTDASGSPTPAAAAYAAMESWLSGAAVNGCAQDAEQVWSCQLVRGGRPAWIVWSVGGTASTSSMGMSTSTDLEGNVRAIAGDGWVTVGEAPILLQ